MAYEYLEIHTDGEPLYRQLYDSLKKAMETGQLRQSSRLPSIRRLSEDLGVSRTTVEAAYQAAAAECGAGATVLAMPYGGSTLPHLRP